MSQPHPSPCFLTEGVSVWMGWAWAWAQAAFSGPSCRQSWMATSCHRVQPSTFRNFPLPGGEGVPIPGERLRASLLRCFSPGLWLGSPRFRIRIQKEAAAHLCLLALPSRVYYPPLNKFSLSFIKKKKTKNRKRGRSPEDIVSSSLWNLRCLWDHQWQYPKGTLLSRCRALGCLIRQGERGGEMRKEWDRDAHTQTDTHGHVQPLILRMMERKENLWGRSIGNTRGSPPPHQPCSSLFIPHTMPPTPAQVS